MRIMLDWRERRDRQHIVHRAGAITLGVERDVQEADGAQGHCDCIEHGKRQRAGQILTGDLDASKLAVMANTHLQKTERVESIFGPFNLAEVLDCHWAAVLDARGETGACRFVGEGETGLAGERADVGFCQPCADQWGKSVVQDGGLLAGPELTAVVEVHSVGEVRKAEFEPCGLHLGKELVLTVEAALGVVADVVGLIQLACLQDVRGNAMLRGEG